MIELRGDSVYSMYQKSQVLQVGMAFHGWTWDGRAMNHCKPLDLLVLFKQNKKFVKIFFNFVLTIQ